MEKETKIVLLNKTADYISRKPVSSLLKPSVLQHWLFGGFGEFGERLKIAVMLLLSANRIGTLESHNHMPRRLAQQWMTSSDLE